MTSIVKNIVQMFQADECPVILMNSQISTKSRENKLTQVHKCYHAIHYQKCIFFAFPEQILVAASG